MKQFFVYGIIGLIFFSCKKQAAHISDATTDSAQQEKVVQQYFEYFNSHDWDKMASLYADSAQMKDPAYDAEMMVMTQSDILKKYSELGQMIPDVRDSIIAIYPSGSQVIVEFISTGTAPDSTKFVLPICTIFTLENGVITKDFTYYDNF